MAEDEEETIYTKYYDINGVTVEKEIWEELTAPFFEEIEHEIPEKTLTEVFGELPEVSGAFAITAIMIVFGALK